jgi:hypothetical protein
MGHQAERSLPRLPPVTVAAAPHRLLVHATQSLWEHALGFVLRVPNRAQRLVHHLIATDHLTRGTLEEGSVAHILELLQAGSRFF